MNTVKFNKNHALMVAHRGVSGLEAENTCAAFVAAGNRSYYGIETDVHRTKDGKYILIHNHSTACVAVDNLDVEASDFADLRAIQLLNKSGVKDRADLVLPSLEEYISICKHYDKIAVLELKGEMGENAVWEIASLIKKADYLHRVIFISFSLDNLAALRKRFPEQPAQLLIDSQFLRQHTFDRLIEILKEYRLDLDAHFSLINEENVRRLHDAGIKINVWTVDDAAEGERMASCGVDYITSNILE